jgi:hypothetical protein
MANLSVNKAGLNSMLARLNASTGASLTVNAPASSLDIDVNSISASKGCPSEDSTVSFPNPAPYALENRTADATAAPNVFRLSEMNFDRVFRRIFCDIDLRSVSACCNQNKHRANLSFLGELSPYHHGLTRASVTNLGRDAKPANFIIRKNTRQIFVAKWQRNLAHRDASNYFSNTIRSMRRNGSAAPHSN